MQITKVFLICLLFISPAFADEGVYNTNLANKDVSWWTVLSTKRRPYVEGVGIVSKGPFLIDVNHRESALLVGPLAFLMNGHGDNDFSGAIGAVNFTDATIRIRMKINADPKRGSIDGVNGKAVFWFQAEMKRRAHAGNGEKMPPRYVNYYSRVDLHSAALAGESVEIDMHPDLNEWTCISRNPVDTRPIIGSAAKYTCAINLDEFKEAMARPINAGVFFMLPEKRADGSNWLLYPDHKWTPIMEGVSFVLSDFEIVQRR